MKFYLPNGNERKLKNTQKYLCDWEAKSRSKFQKNVKDMVFPFWCADVVFEEFPVIGTRMTLDFFNATRRIAIEIDGVQHTKYNPFFHGGSRRKFLEQVERDLKKEEFCDNNEIKLLRICHDDDLTKIVIEENLTI
jgi:very-short-patch-repair endonuclease